MGQRPQLAVEGPPVEPVGLECSVGFHPIDGFPKLVEVARGMAIALRIKKLLQGFSHEAQLLTG
jgi:hypothetical protein